MVIWTGQGWVGFIYVVGCLIGGERLMDCLLGDGYFESRLWPKFAALLVCTALCWVTGRLLNRSLPRRVFAVPGKNVPADAAGHTLAFVRLEYGGLVAAPLYLFIAAEQAGLI